MGEMVDLATLNFSALVDDEKDNDVSAPKQVFLYRVGSLNKNFDDALSMKPDFKKKLDAKKLNSANGHIINLKKNAKSAVKFGKLEKLMIFLASNQEDSDATFITGIKFEGSSTAKTDMDRWNDVKCKP